MAELFAAVPRVHHTPHPTGLWFPGFTCSPSTGMVAAGDMTVPRPGSPGRRVPGGTAGSVLVSRIHLAALAEATPVPAKGLQ